MSNRTTSTARADAASAPVAPRSGRRFTVRASVTRGNDGADLGSARWIFGNAGTRAGIDPRVFQAATLAGLLLCGVLILGFDQSPVAIAVLIAMSLSVEWLGRRLSGKPFDPLSPLITAFSLAILLRTSGLGVTALAAVLAIGSKFVLRVNGRHVFNPASFAIAILVSCTGSAWISPGQWGATATLVFAFSALAGLILARADRVDTALAFLLAWSAILVGRALWLGDPMAIPLRQLQSGALLLFAFFMLTDPRTTPARRGLRIAHAFLVAMLAAWLQFGLWKPEALIYALVVVSPLVPVLDRLFPAVAAGPPSSPVSL